MTSEFRRQGDKGIGNRACSDARILAHSLNYRDQNKVHERRAAVLGERPVRIFCRDGPDAMKAATGKQASRSVLAYRLSRCANGTSSSVKYLDKVAAIAVRGASLGLVGARRTAAACSKCCSMYSRSISTAARRSFSCLAHALGTPFGARPKARRDSRSGPIMFDWSALTIAIAAHSARLSSARPR